MPAAALAALLALAACTPSQPTPSPTPTSAHAPLFTSDAEALKAATDAYAAYLKMSDTISHEGGADPERIKPYVTAHAYAGASSSFKVLRDRRWHTVGDTTFRDEHLAQFGADTVSIYLCSDVSAVRVFDEAGADVTPTTRTDVLPIEVTFRSREDKLLLESSDRWSGANFC
jgi:hypothetical protein